MYTPLDIGGIAAYAREQAIALSQCGVSVTLLAPGKNHGFADEHYTLIDTLMPTVTQTKNPLARRWRYVEKVLFNVRQLEQQIQQLRPDAVLLSSYSEYLAPLWAWRLRRWQQRGIRFGAIVHDPVRDFQVGPAWWHRWSIAEAYSFLEAAFVHQAIALDTAHTMPRLHTYVLPHGPYRFPPATLNREQLRDRLQLPHHAPVMLAFGHIRDNKNLDLVIQAMAKIPNVYLLVAGSEPPTHQKPVQFYRDLAESFGVSDHIRWQIRFIPDSEVSHLFTVADLVLLTYSSSFRSASGVLNTAATFRKPCLASSGESDLKTAVEGYQLGFWVQPDCPNAIQEGIQSWLNLPPQPYWEQYLSDHSWTRNAEVILKWISQSAVSNNL